VIDRC